MIYSELKTAVQNELRSSETNLLAQFDNFFIATEDTIFGAIEGSQFFKAVTDTALVSGTDTYSVDDGNASLGVMEILSVRISEAVATAQASVEYGPVRYLLQKEYDFLLEVYPGSASAETIGVPKYYAIADRVLTAASKPDIKIRLAPIPDGTYSMTTTYLGKPSTDSITVSDATSTWLSIAYPDALVSGALSRSGAFMRMDTPASKKWDQQFMSWLAIIKNTVVTRSTGDAYRSSTPAATTPTRAA